MKYFFFFILFYAVIAVNVSAQFVNDAGSWNTLTLQAPLHKKLLVNIDQEIRLNENISRLNQLFTQIGFNIKVKKWLRIEPSYRFISKLTDVQTFSYRHRLSFDVILKQKISRLSISLRNRFQQEYQDYLSSENGIIPERFYRLRLQAEIPLKSYLSFFYNIELRYQINVPGRNSMFNNRWHRIRNVLGLDYSFNEFNILSCYYLIQNEYDIVPINNQYILGFQYTYKFGSSDFISK